MPRSVTRASEGLELAGIYARLSLARFGDTTKVEDQVRIGRGLAASRGWTVPDHMVFCDNNRSAWQRNRKRPEWDRMVAMVKDGTLRNLVNYHGDRLIRQPYDLEMLLNFADQLGVVIVSPTGEYQLDVAHDRFILRILTAKACLESDDISRRKKDGFERMRHEGIAPPAGSRYGRGFGYDTTGRTPVPAEAAVVREVAGRLVAGEPLSVIAADLTARGARSVSGGPLDYQNLKRILLRPRVAGLLADGTPGTWPAILDRETWEMVGGVLRSRAGRLPGATNSAKYLLSGIARCGRCGSGLQRQSAGRRGRLSIDYGCVQQGCRGIHRNMAHLDAYVTGAVVALLNDPQMLAALARPRQSPVAAEIAVLEARRAQAKAQADRLADEPGADLEMLARAVASFGRKIESLRAQLPASAGEQVRAGHAGITWEQFEALPLRVRRSVVAACFTVTVLPASKRGPGFHTEDVQLSPRGMSSHANPPAPGRAAAGGGDDGVP